MNFVLDVADVDAGPAKALDSASFEDKARRDLGSTDDVNLAGAARIHGLKELIDLGDQRCALPNRNDNVCLLLHETELSIDDMKRGSEPVVSVGPDDPLYWTIPLEMTKPFNAFPNDGFLVIDLAVVSDVLPVTAACLAYRLLPVR